MAKELGGVRDRWQAEVHRQSALPDRSLNWTEAVAWLHQSNHKLRAARTDITNSEEQVDQVFRDLIPNVTLRSGVTKRLTDIGATSVKDVTFSIDSFFNIPGVVNFDARLFAARLGALRAKTAYDLVVREQTIELYKVFLEAEEHSERRNELKLERALANVASKVNELTGESLLSDIETAELTLAKDDDLLQLRIGDLLMSQQFHWVLLTNGLPEFDYQDQPLPLADTNRVAQLQMRLAALELVRGWATLHGIKLQYWPELTIFVSGPTLFQHSSGQNHFWSTKDITASANLFWTLDTRGYIRQALRETKRAQELEYAQLRREAETLIAHLLAAQKLGGSLRDQLRQYDQMLTLFGEMPQSPDLNALVQATDANRSLTDQRLRLRRDLAELNTLFWFVDEDRWQTSIQ